MSVRVSVSVYVRACERECERECVCVSHLRSTHECSSPLVLISGQHSSLCETPYPLHPHLALADAEGEEQ